MVTATNLNDTYHIYRHSYKLNDNFIEIYIKI